MKYICKEFHLGYGDSVKSINEWFLLHSEDIRIKTISYDKDYKVVYVFYTEEPPDEKSNIIAFDRVMQVIG